jgi:hypothetical protein
LLAEAVSLSRFISGVPKRREREKSKMCGILKGNNNNDELKLLLKVSLSTWSCLVCVAAKLGERVVPLTPQGFVKLLFKL